MTQQPAAMTFAMPAPAGRPVRIEEYFANLRLRIDKSSQIVGFCFPTKEACDEWAALGAPRIGILRIWRAVGAAGWQIEVIPDSQEGS